MRCCRTALPLALQPLFGAQPVTVLADTVTQRVRGHLYTDTYVGDDLLERALKPAPILWPTRWGCGD